MISNTDIMRFTFIKNRFPEILIFDGYALSFDLGLRKPDPEIYRAALRSVGSRPENAIFIDDIQENIESAERLGIKGILFTTGTDLEVELGKFGVKA
jgi:putative hydrolase of the HAD superfamily